MVTDNTTDYASNVKKLSPGLEFLSNINFGQLGTATNSALNNDYGQAAFQTLGSMPGIAGAIGQGLGLVDQLFAPMVKFKKLEDANTLNQSSTFGGSKLTTQKAESDLSKAKSKGLIGRLFAKKKTNKSINKANEVINKTTDILTQGEQANKLANQSQGLLQQQQSNILAGNPQGNFLFKEGGTLGDNPNIIPEGKLHAHKHNLKDEVEELKDIPMSSKGIPVMAVKEDGTMEQHAEIERGELILNTETTAKIMDLFKKGDKEAKIEAGKLLAKELLTNTKDFTETLL